ncbi:MotA/TolQ/ExbB proton channel family protein [Aeromonas bivalvium]|uniref:MotA/TolQ/ExbB proton channel family protein n=1 Tax=Aeromonas bivalvium TaxID=440079 RepID=A0ABW9GSS8_9GAMM|nr:MotA/TolQ/ExbB proton channel family protein [Aeromonas bivalvium]
MKQLPLIIALMLAQPALANENWQAQEQLREQEASQELGEVSKSLASARARLNAAQQQSKQLASEFADNEKRLGELKAQWQQAASDMDQVFAVARQGAGDAVKLLGSSAMQGQFADRLLPLQQMSREQDVPDRAALAQLPALLMQEIAGSAQVTRFEAEVLDGQGASATQQVTRIGSFMLVGQDGLLQAGADGLAPVLGLPASLNGAALSYGGAEGEAAVIDPSHGVLLAMQTQAPSLWQQIQQGGKVGAIIVLLAVIGLGIAAVRLWSLSRELGRVRRQLASGDYHADNALGRVLLVADKHPEIPMETLELRLDEAILQETPRLERGLGMVKVIAALAPMLGLLGTVTGMIGTFQSITLFGTGDPKIMAGGISMALITTVMGLVAAIPLILSHSLLQSRFVELSNVLEQQVAGILAERAEGKVRTERAA